MSMNRVDPRIRAHGKARIDITRRAKDEQEWQRLWKESRYPFPFKWGSAWKHAIQYKVDDFAAEVGFLIDVLGLAVYAFSPNYALFTSPGQEFTFGVACTQEGELSTPQETLRIQFMVEDILATAEELESRGIVFEQKPQPDPASGSPLYCGYFRTPHGICIDLLGLPGEIEEALRSDVSMEEPGNLSAFSWPEVEELSEAEAFSVPDERAKLDEELEEEQESHPADFLPFGGGEEDDPFAGLVLPATTPPQEPLKSELERNKSAEENSRQEGSGSVEEDFGLWSRTNSGRNGSSRHGLPPRSDSSSRVDPPRRSPGSRGNRDSRKIESRRRTGGPRRKNPFDHSDLPPLGDLPGFIDKFSQRREMPGLSGKPAPEEPHSADLVEDSTPQPEEKTGLPYTMEGDEIYKEEPQYEDIEDENSQDLDSHFP